MSKTKDQNTRIEASEFEWIGPDPSAMEGMARPATGFWKDAMGRLLKNKMAIACFVILGLIFLLAVFVPMLSPYTFSEQHMTHTNAGMFYKDSADGHMHLFGTDTLGRDLLVRLFSGARVSLFIAITIVILDCLFGLLYGGIAGYFGGAVDNIMMRIIEVISGVPYLIVVILLMVVMKPGMSTIIIAYAIVGWTGMARLVRGQIASLKEQEFVVAASVMGASPARIILKHLIPNILSIVIVNVTLDVPRIIFAEAFLSFIGLGVPIPIASWGTLANDGNKVFQMYPYQLALPAFFISLTMLSFNLLGDALRDVLDPKLRR